jgi:hypothetical protein
MAGIDNRPRTSGIFKKIQLAQKLNFVQIGVPEPEWQWAEFTPGIRER